ncbi:MAG: GatB/YqeY domain-containing protein [Clostridia bacterium]|nr:GatB/YqeY domain-containing protein [Clostridia bacterium]
MQIEDFKKVKIEAMKAHDKDAVTALNALINKLMLLSIERRAAGEEMTDADVVQVMQKTINELIEEREGFLKAGRNETVASLDNQLATVKKYLPKMLTEEEIKEIILSLPDKTTPYVMRHFKANYAGKVDMRLVGVALKNLAQ